MKIDVIAKNSGVSEKVKNYAQEKVGKLERFFDRLMSAKVVLEKKGEQNRAEVVITTGSGTTIVGEFTHDQTLYAAVDAAIDKLERQVKKHKEKLVERNRKKAR